MKTSNGSRKLFYTLRRLVTLGGTSTYILMNTGILTDNVSDTSVNIMVFVLGGWALITFIKDYKKRATDKENPNIGQLARATALNEMVPWIVVIIIATALVFGIANMAQHLIVISSLQIGGKIFGGFELKYDTMVKRGIEPKQKEGVEEDVQVA